MLRFDPPKKVIYDNIEIAKEGDSDTLAQVTQTLASVGTNDVFNYLIDKRICWARRIFTSKISANRFEFVCVLMGLCTRWRSLAGIDIE